MVDLSFETPLEKVLFLSKQTREILKVVDSGVISPEFRHEIEVQLDDAETLMRMLVK